MSRPGRQFNMRDLLVFTFACGVYLAVIVSLQAAASPYSRIRALPLGVTIPGAWAVLWVVYRWWGPRQALIVHYSGPVLIGGFLALIASLTLVVATHSPSPRDYSWTPDFRNYTKIVYFGLLLGCGLGTIVSFPASLLMRLYLLVAPDHATVDRSRRLSKARNTPASPYRGFRRS